MTTAPTDERPDLHVVPDQQDTRPVRTPPHDLAAEQCVLGAMLLSKDAIADVVEIVKTNDFYQPKHGIVYDAILDLYGKGEPADVVTVAAALIDSGDIGRVGGAAYLHDLVNTIPTAANGSYYARIVADRSVRRRTIEGGTRITQLGYGTGGDSADIVDQAQQIVYNLTDQNHSSDADTFGDLVAPTFDEMELIAGHDGALRGISTGYLDLDRLLGGYQGGQLILVAARPGLGKSVFGTDALRACAFQHNIPGVLFSLEMSKVEVVMRLMAAAAGVPLEKIRNGGLSDNDWTKIANKMADLNEAPLLIDDTPNMTLMEIRAKARRLVQRQGVKLIVVDYLQLISSRGRAENRQQEVSEISRGLKLLAKELDVPVIAACQLNRGPEQRTDKRPLMADLRESGSLEQDADIVILLHRDDYYDKESPRAGEADFIVAKHRNGPTDTITVAAQLHLSRFKDMAVQ